jgi:amidase
MTRYEPTPAAVANVCDPNYVMLASIAKAHLGGAEAYGAAHARLRRG